MNFLKSKAVFMIVIIVMSIFTVYLMNTEEVNAENVVCCEKTLDGESCGERENLDECDVSNSVSGSGNPYLTINNDCTEASFCQPGCCIFENGLDCSKNSIEKACTDLGGIFEQDDSMCETHNECDNGCCMLKPFSCGISTEIECQQDSLLYNIPYEWDQSLNEIECSQECLQVEKGCCVTGNGILPSDFSVTTSDNCNGEFHPYMLCSNPSLASPCTEKHHTSCNPVDSVDVYWFDSCGNIENIMGVDGDGYFVDTTCPNNDNNGNINSNSCGDCDYTLGSICSNTTIDMDDENAKHICSDLNCEEIYDFKSLDGSNINIMLWDDTGKLNGQSWCIYEGFSGEGKDLVGSRHYVHSCINGKELWEECDERRQQICVQNSETEPTQANCRVNLAVACIYCNTANNPQECCGNIQPDCQWISYIGDIATRVAHPRRGETIGKCLPNYPLGTLHEEQSDGFSFDCKEKWCDSLTTHDHCEKNCFCSEEGFAEEVNKMCMSLGDFGFKYNIAGEDGNSGFYSEIGVPQSSLSYYMKMLKGIYSQFVPGYYDIEDLIEAGVLPEGFSIPGRSGDILRWGLIGAGLAGAYLCLALIPGLTLFASGTVAGAAGGAGAGGAILPFGLSGLVGALIFVIVIVIIFILFILIFGESCWTKTYYYSCGPWEPPAGGADCSKCMGEYKICDRYKCESLGLMCHYNEEDQTCMTYDLNDASPPIITPLTSYLEQQDYEVIQTGNDGYEIKNKDYANGKFDPGDVINLAINTTDPPHNLPTICKISKEHYTGYDADGDRQTELQFFNLLTNSFQAGRSYQHIKSIGYDFFDEENINYEIGENIYYAHCKDGMSEEDGGPNIKTNYWIKFNVNDVPDLSPVVIDPDSYSLPSGSYIEYNANNTDISFNINKPGECRYSTSSKPFYEMSEGGDCGYINPGVYRCTLNLPINENTNNYFFFRCNSYNNITNEEDQPSNGLLLKGTIPLEITSASPNNNILYNPNVTIHVETSDGAENGKSKCYFSNNQNINPYNSVQFFSTDSSTSIQTLTLNSGTYTYYILCQDIAGNQALTNITFTVDTTNLTIENVLPANNSVIYLDNTLLQVTTEGGNNNNGDCNCYYNNNLIVNKQTSSSQTVHTKNLTGLVNGIYNYDILCNDEYKQDSYYLRFNVDLESVPVLIQVYTTYTLLNIVTDNPAECKYTTTGDFTYEQGNLMASSNNYNHLANINSNIFYIKCKHRYTNVISDLYTIYI